MAGISVRHILPLVVAAAMLVGRAAGAETFGNFHTLGIVLDPPAGVQPAEVVEVRLFDRADDPPRRLLDPVRVGDFNWYAVSVFDLEPGRDYAFRAEFLDAGGTRLGEEEFGGGTRPEPGPLPPAMREIHVAVHGDDAAPGSVWAPKKTVTAACAAAGPGTHVVLHEGVYHEGPIVLRTKASAAAPLVIRAAPGERAILDGSDPAAATAGWNDLGGGAFARPWAGVPHLACIEWAVPPTVRRLYPVATAADLAARRVGGHGFETFDIREAYHAAEGELRVFCPDFRPGGPSALRIGRGGGAFELSQAAHVVFAGVEFRYFDGQALYVNDSSDVTIRGCSFAFTNVPIAVKRTSDRLLVERCRFQDDCARWGFLPKSSAGGDYSAWIETGAVSVHHPFDGRGLVVRDNAIDGLFDGAHLTPGAISPTPRTSEIDFYRNTVTGVCDDALEVDGFSRNVRVFDNTMRGCLSGISIAQAVHGPTWVVRNVIADFGRSTAVTLPPHFEGYPVKTNGGAEHGTTGWAFFAHNTAVTTAPRTNAFRVQEAAWSRLVFANNIWAGTRDGLVLWRDVISPVDIRRDIVFASTGCVLRIGRTVYPDGPSATRGFHPFSNAIVADPRLTSPTEGDFRPLADSPAIDAAVSIPGINDRGFAGLAPDIGAIERRSEP